MITSITAEMRQIGRTKLKNIMERDCLLRNDVALGMGVQHQTVTRILDEVKDRQWSKETLRKLLIYLKKKKDKPLFEECIY